MVALAARGAVETRAVLNVITPPQREEEGRSEVLVEHDLARCRLDGPAVLIQAPHEQHRALDGGQRVDAARVDGVALAVLWMALLRRAGLPAPEDHAGGGRLGALEDLDRTGDLQEQLRRRRPAGGGPERVDGE